MYLIALLCSTSFSTPVLLPVLVPPYAVANYLRINTHLSE
jgi:hypothetical protein